MTARPQLRLIRSCDIPPEPWWRHQLWRIREAASSGCYWILRTALALVATAPMRERAWAEGFAVALGNTGARSRLQHLDEWRQGNEAAWDLRCDRGDRGAPPPAPAGTARVRAVLEYLGAATPQDRRVHGTCCPFVLPAVLPVADGPVAAGWHWRRRGRHARPGWPRLAARWLLRALPGFGQASGPAADRDSLRVAA